MDYIGVTFAGQLPGAELFFSGVHLHRGPAPAHRFPPDLVERIDDRQIDPGSRQGVQPSLSPRQAPKAYRTSGGAPRSRSLLTT